MIIWKRFKEFLREPTCMKAQHPLAVCCRVVYAILFVYYIKKLTTIQQYNLPEGPPFFNAMIETKRNHRYNYIDRKVMSDGEFRETMKQKNDSIHEAFLSMPLGVCLIQLAGVFRLCCSCFVGYREYEYDVTNLQQVLFQVRSQMALELIISFPYQIWWFLVKFIYEEDSANGEILWSVIFFLNVVPTGRLVIIYRDLLFIRRYVGWFFDVVFLFLAGFMVECLLFLLWYQLPEWFCGSFHSKMEKFQVIQCFDERCSFFKLKEDHCFVQSTWWSTLSWSLQPAIIHRTLSLFDVNINASLPTTFIEKVYWINTISELFYVSQFFIFSGTKQIGLGYILPLNDLEMFVIMFVIIAGIYYYNWKFVGIISSIAMAQDSSLVARADQLEIVESYCDIEDMPEENRNRINNFAKMLTIESNICIFSNPICQSLLPEDYQNDLIEETVFKAVVEKIRIFRDLDSHMQLVLAYQFKTEYYMAGETVVKDKEIPRGIGYIHRGHIYAIHPDVDLGAMVKLGPGDFFGELGLVKSMPSPLLLQTSTNCEIWMLHRNRYQRLAEHFPARMKQLILVNYLDVLKIQDCRFHERLDSRRPKFFVQSAINFNNYGPPFNVPHDPFAEGLNTFSHKARIVKRRRIKCNWQLHDGMKFLRMWSYVMGVLGIFSGIIGLYDMRPQDMGNLRTIGLSDVIWPNNPVAYYRLWRENKADAVNKFVYSFSLLMTAVCFCDLIIWFLTAISTPYGLVSGMELLKRKLSPKYQGFSTSIKFVSTLWLGLKFMRLREVINMHIRFRQQIFPFLILSIICLLMICHYVARLEYLCAYFYWIANRGPKVEESLCSNLQKEWGKTMTEMERYVYKLTNKWLMRLNINNSQWDVEDPFAGLFNNNLDAIQYYLSVSDKHSKEVVEKSRTYLIFLINFHFLCTQDWETQLAESSYYESESFPYYDFYLRYLLSLFSIATTEGSDVIAYLPGTYGYYWSMVIVTIIGMFILAIVNAKITAHETANVLPVTQIFTKLESIKAVMRQLNVDAVTSNEVNDYLSLCYLGTNRTTMRNEAKLLYSIPHRIRITHEQKQYIKDQCFFCNATMTISLVESSSYLIFPPKTYMFRAGDLFLGYFIIAKGYCLQIDLLGKVMVKGPGSSVGMASLWAGQHLSTAVTHTYVRGFWVDASMFIRSLRRCPKEKHLFEGAFMELEEFVAAAQEEIATKDKIAIHAQNVEALLEPFQFTNATSCTIRKNQNIDKQDRRYVEHLRYCWFLERTFSPYGKLGFSLFVARLILLYASTGILLLQCVLISVDQQLCFIIGLLDTFLIVDWYLRLNIYIYEDGVALRNQTMIWRHWKKTEALWDFVTLFPLELFVWPLISVPNVQSQERIVLIAVRSLRMLRAISYKRAFIAFKEIFPKKNRTHIFISLIFALFSIIHTTGCLWLLVLCQPGINDTGPKPYVQCRHDQWIHKFYSREYINIEYKTLTAISDSDHANFFFLKEPTCPFFMELPESHPCSCYRAFFFRYFLSGFQEVELHEGTAPIWIDTQFVQVLDYYLVALYWASQVVGTLGLGDINSTFREDLLVSLIALFFAVLWRCYIMCNLVSIRIDYSHDQALVFRRIAAQRAYLKHYGFHKNEISRVTQCEEIRFASKCHLIRSERRHMIDFMFCKISAAAIEDTFRRMGILQKFSKGQLRFLAAHVEWQVLPKGEFLFRDRQVVSVIVILKDGLLKIQSPEDIRRTSTSQEELAALEMVSLASSAEDEGNEVKNSTSHQQNGLKVGEDTGSLGFLRPGAVLGISGNHDLEFWTGNVIAFVPSSIFVLHQEVINNLLSTDAGSSFAAVVEALHEEVHKTKASITTFIQQQKIQKKKKEEQPRHHWSSRPLRVTGKVSLSERSKRFKYARVIFHPSESHVNIFFLSAILFKWVMFVGSVIYCVVIHVADRSYKNKRLFFTLFNIIQVLSTLITIIEMIIRLHVGYVDKNSGRIIVEAFKVYRRYFKTFRQFPLDVFSLVPVWLAVDFKWNVLGSRDDLSLPENIGIRLLTALPLVTILLQLIRSNELFQLPRQAQPFNTKILQVKYGIRVLLIIFTVFSIFSVIWILAGCRNSLDMTRCDINGWVNTVYSTRSNTVKNEFDLFMVALNFVVSVAIGAGFGDITAHNEMEMTLLCIMVISCIIVNCELQAQVLSAVYTQVLREERNDREMEALKAGLHSLQLSPGLYESVVSFVQICLDGYQDTNDTIQDLFADLHVTLRQEINYKLCKPFLRQIPSLLAIDRNVLKYLSLFVEEKIFLPGDFLVSHGDLDDHVIYVVSGSAVVTWKKMQYKVEPRNVVLAHDPKRFKRKSALQYPRVADYDCIAQTVVVVYRLSLASLGHVIYSLAGHMLQMDIKKEKFEGDKDAAAMNEFKKIVADGLELPTQEESGSEESDLNKNRVSPMVLSPVPKYGKELATSRAPSLASSFRKRHGASVQRRRITFSNYVPEISASDSLGGRSLSRCRSSVISVRRRQGWNIPVPEDDLSLELAEGFDRKEHLKILYLAQWYNLQKCLLTKLNAFGRNQIMSFLAWEKINSLVKAKTIPLTNLEDTFAPAVFCLNPRRNIARCFVDIRPLKPDSPEEFVDNNSELNLNRHMASVPRSTEGREFSSDLQLNLVVTCPASRRCPTHAQALNLGVTLMDSKCAWCVGRETEDEDHDENSESRRL